MTREVLSLRALNRALLSRQLLTIEPFGRVPDRDLVVREAERMLAFCAPDASHQVRFAPA